MGRGIKDLKHSVPYVSKKILFIGGCDNSSGAGLLADMETAWKLKASGCVAVTAITAQNESRFVEFKAVEPSLLFSQLKSIDRNVGAIKIGMLPDEASIEIVSEFLSQYSQVPIVLDPVFQSTTGAKLFHGDTLSRLKTELIPKVSLLTPNSIEASKLTGLSCEDLKQAKSIATVIMKFGVKAVLLKGGHLEGKDCTDILVQKNSPLICLKKQRYRGGTSARGTGCRLASAIACYLADGDSIETATRKATRFVEKYILQNRTSNLELDLTSKASPN